MKTGTFQWSISKASDGGFESAGLRDFFEYRDLGIRDATNGAFGAHVIRARERCTDGTGRHQHSLGFQMFYVLKGTCTFWYEGKGTFELEQGDCVHQPPGIVHELQTCSGDCEILEITMPAKFGTDDA